MPEKPDWMGAIHLLLLWILNEKDPLALTKGSLTQTTGFERGYLGDMVDELVEVGLLDTEAEDGSYDRYRISDLGKQYLRGELSAEELPEPE